MTAGQLHPIRSVILCPFCAQDVEAERDDEESHQSEGQLVPVCSQSDSDDSEISEEILEGEEMLINVEYQNHSQSNIIVTIVKPKVIRLCHFISGSLTLIFVL